MADDGGLASFRRRMKAIPENVRAAVKPALLKSGEEMADAMRALVPVDSGDLKDSITVTGPNDLTPRYSTPGGAKRVPENAVAITVGNDDVRYGHLVEHGTTKAPAQPYFWPGYRLTKKRTAARIKRAIGKAVRTKS